jgi:hypothetical protein
MRRPVTDIRGDAEQTAAKLETTAGRLACALERARDEGRESDRVVSRTVDSLNRAFSEGAAAVRARRDRLLFHRRALAAALADHQRLIRWRGAIEARCEAEKGEYRSALEGLRAAWAEVEDGLGSRIQIALRQLKSLRQFQEFKHRIDQQRRQAAEALLSERRRHSRELTAIHCALLGQRECYGRGLAGGLAAARRFVADFSDLHMDRLSERIAGKAGEQREWLRAADAEALEMVTTNERLRVRLRRREQQRQVYSMGLERAESELARLKAQAEAAELSLNAQRRRSQSDVTAVRESADLRVGELRTRLHCLREQNLGLKQEAAAAAHDLATVEEARCEHFRREYSLMDAMSGAAVFLLTALDDRFGPVPQEDAVRNQRSALNQIIRKLVSIRTEAQREAPPPVEKADAAVQTEEITPRVVLAAPPLLPSVVGNSRRRALQQRFSQITESKRVFAAFPVAGRARGHAAAVAVKSAAARS